MCTWATGVTYMHFSKVKNQQQNLKEKAVRSSPSDYKTDKENFWVKSKDS